MKLNVGVPARLSGASASSTWATAAMARHWASARKNVSLRSIAKPLFHWNSNPVILRARCRQDQATGQGLVPHSATDVTGARRGDSCRPIDLAFDPGREFALRRRRLPDRFEL